MRGVAMRWTVTLGCVSALAAGCGSESRSLVRGQLSSEGFNLDGAHVAAIADDGTTWLAPLTSDGRFSVELPKQTRLTLRFARPTDQPDVYDAFAVLMTPMDRFSDSQWFSMPSHRNRIDLGTIVPRRHRAALTARPADGEDDDEGTDDDDEGDRCDDDDGDDDGSGSGSGVVDDNDEESACGAVEDDDEGGTPVDPTPTPRPPPPVDQSPPSGGGPPRRSPPVVALQAISVCDVQQGADLLEVIAQHAGRLTAERDGHTGELDLMCRADSGPVTAKASPGLAHDV